MKNQLIVLARAAALIGLLLVPGSASAQIFTLSCEPSRAPAPADWVGAPWTQAIRLRINVPGREVDLIEADSSRVTDTLQVVNTASLAGYDFDIVINENVINWGIRRMWGFSGYFDRRSGQVHLTWVHPSSYSPEHVRQFHGTCRPE